MTVPAFSPSPGPRLPLSKRYQLLFSLPTRILNLEQLAPSPVSPTSRRSREKLPRTPEDKTASLFLSAPSASDSIGLSDLKCLPSTRGPAELTTFVPGSLVFRVFQSSSGLSVRGSNVDPVDRPDNPTSLSPLAALLRDTKAGGSPGTLSV